MAPRTRNISKKATKLVPTMERLMVVELADMVFNSETTEFSTKADKNLIDFFEKVEELAACVSESVRSSIDVKAVLVNYLEGVPKPVIPHPEIKQEETSKNDTLQCFDTSSMSFKESREEVSMKVDDEDLNRTYDIFGVRSETLTSSEDDVDTTAVSEATTQLEEMSLTEELDMNTPLHTSTPVKSEDASYENEIVTTVFNPPKMEMVSEGSEGDSTVKSENGRQKERNPVSGVQYGSMLSANVSHRSTSHHSNFTSQLTAKQEPKDHVSTIDSIGLNSPKKENLQSDSKIAHANNLRNKFMMTKKERLREENEKKTALEIAQKRLQEEQEMKMPSSSSRHGTSLKRTETFTPNSRPSKKTRVHLFSKEDKPPRLDDGEVLIVEHEPETSTRSIKTRIKKTENSYPTTPKCVYSRHTADDYGIDDLSSGEETDDESNPRKPIPRWANSDRVKKNVRKQIENPPFDIDEFFGTVEKPVLREIFGRNN